MSDPARKRDKNSVVAKSNDPDSESNLSVPESGPNTEGGKGERSARVSPSQDAPSREAPLRVERSGSSLHPVLARKHALQRAVSTITGPIWVGVTILWMRLVARYRIADVRKVREQYRRIRRQSNSPIVICGNHLTLVDSFLMAWALGSGGYWVTHPDELPWNTPESKNFARTWYSRLFIFMAKCIPITRGGARESVGDVLERVKHLLIRGETALLFPEAGRSRTGRVEENSSSQDSPIIGARSSRTRLHASSSAAGNIQAGREATRRRRIIAPNTRWETAQKIRLTRDPARSSTRPTPPAA